MTFEGPALEVLIRRLEDCPQEFQEAPRMGKQGSVSVEAVVSDLLRDLGADHIDRHLLEEHRPPAKQVEAWLRAVLIGAWLLHDPWFRDHGSFAGKAAKWLAEGLQEVSSLVAPDAFVADQERREELVRLALDALGLRPAGETEEQSQDRLNTLNSLERERVIRAARAAEERSKAIRDALAKKRAYEAADKWNRE